MTTTTEAIDDVIKRYSDCNAWAARERAAGFKGLLMPYEGATADAIAIADHACDVLPKVREALESCRDFFADEREDRYPIVKRIRDALALLDGKVGEG